MKSKIFNIFALGLLTAGLASCGDSFLDVESKTETTTENYYKTENDASRALIGCYDGWQCTVSNGPTFALHYLTELLSDECFGGTGANDARNSQLIDRLDIGQDPSQVNLFDDLWTYYYAAIYRCNELIAHEDQIGWSNEETRGRIMGEARAIRAICYFDLVRLFENVPLLTAPSSDNLPQAAPAEVYAQIVEDLKYAAANIPADAYPKADAANNDGRITSYAAKALLARVYLFYNGVYGGEPGTLTKAEALQGLEEIIRSGEYSLVPLFKNLWFCASTTFDENNKEVSTYAGDGNSEVILDMKFNYTSDYNGNAGGNNAIQMFSKSEGIEDMSEYQKALSDQREYTGYFNKKYTARSKYFQDEKGNWSLTHYYNDVMAGDFQISQPISFVVMRYADVLLMAAELGSSNAQNYFNQVRQRAFTEDNGEGGTQLSGYYQAKTATKANILEERRLEFAFEGQRWFDLRRQDADGSIAAAAITAGSGEVVLTGGSEEIMKYTASNITSKRGFMQIPLTQIQRSNGVLKQNAGW